MHQSHTHAQPGEPVMHYPQSHPAKHKDISMVHNAAKFYSSSQTLLKFSYKYY